MSKLIDEALASWDFVDEEFNRVETQKDFLEREIEAIAAAVLEQFRQDLRDFVFSWRRDINRIILLWIVENAEKFRKFDANKNGD